MSDVAIRVEGLSKRYRIGKLRERANGHHSLLHKASAPLRALSNPFAHPDPSEFIWSLKDVSFEVQRGEVLGVIGRNGAGKSTLLKVLSRITEPTAGRAKVHGRVGSLLEVGTGFHPELTGRENTYLNGAILGMKKGEIDRKFDEIVAFAGLAQFIYTPVKRYSSGMYVRLAFAVAAHLEPEILLVDEVLAVGDAEFEKKCLSKMGDVATEGRTVLFVSHNMGAIKSLCARALYLDGGCIVGEGNVHEVVAAYLKRSNTQTARGIIADDAPREYSTGEVKIRAGRLCDAAGRDMDQLYLGQPFRVDVTFEVLKDVRDALVEVSIFTLDGTHVTQTMSTDGGQPPLPFARGMHTVGVDIDIVLLPRQYTLLLGLHHSDGLTIDWIERALDFTVLNAAENGGDRYRWATRGFVRPAAEWHLTERLA
ncbi:MAG: ABC transporter ATP-binding protein [Chloroflexota bacterium]